MGSGCNQSIFNNCVSTTSSDCVLYQGDPNTTLGICTGDTITEVSETLINAVNNFTATGDNVSLTSLILTCSDLISILGSKTQNVTNVLSALDVYTCQLKTLINTTNTTIGATSLNLGCLTPSNNSLYGVMQALINAYCATQATVNALNGSIASSVNTNLGGYLNTALISPGNYGITKSGSGSSFTAKFTAFIPPYCPIAYFGSLSNFSGSGVGVVGSAYEGWYLCNGSNGTPDLRGRSLVGSVSDIPSGGTLAPSVDPTNSINSLANVGYKINDKFGENFHQNSIAEMPAHSHTVNDPGHSHLSGHSPKGWASSGTIGVSNETATNPTSTSLTGITINSTGSNLQHENRQPSIACAWIMRIN